MPNKQPVKVSLDIQALFDLTNHLSRIAVREAHVRELYQRLYKNISTTKPFARDSDLSHVCTLKAEQKFTVLTPDDLPGPRSTKGA
jgi:hypothetical protein